MSKWKKKKLVLNVDTGVDDALSIMLALTEGGREWVRPQLLAVLCSWGNVSVEQVLRNTAQVLDVCQGMEVSVYQGARCSLLGSTPQPDPSHVHGLDGLGLTGGHEETLERPAEATSRVGSAEPAAQALVTLANKYPGEITLVSMAPLTNVALALRLDPSLGGKLKETVVMGGNVEARGRVSPCAEFNFHCDPEAAHVCLNELTCPVTVLPYEVCLRCPFPWDWVESLLDAKTPKSTFMRTILSHAVNLLKNIKKLPAFYTCDPLAVAYALDDRVALGVSHRHCTVELHGVHTRGQMVVDWRAVQEKPANVRIVEKIDEDIVRAMLETLI